MFMPHTFGLSGRDKPAWFALPQRHTDETGNDTKDGISPNVLV